MNLSIFFFAFFCSSQEDPDRPPPVIEPKQLFDGRKVIMKINGNHQQMEYLFQCKLIDSFLGPASPLILESCDIPVQDYSLARVEPREGRREGVKLVKGVE